MLLLLMQESLPEHEPELSNHEFLASGASYTVNIIVFEGVDEQYEDSASRLRREWSTIVASSNTTFNECLFE
jgi:hypothetical protein